jgi:hypothetical protein
LTEKTEECGSVETSKENEEVKGEAVSLHQVMVGFAD